MSNPSYGMKKSDVLLFRPRSLREAMANLDPDDLAELDGYTSMLVRDWMADQNVPLFLLDTLIGAVKCVRSEREAF